jgi:DNA-binding transcriptional ArsR family regulator
MLSVVTEPRTTDEQEDRADALFHALADRTRRHILRRVLAGEHSVSVLAEAYDMSFAAVQKHVAVLERAGLLTKRRDGRRQLASGDVEAVRSVAAMLGEIEDVWRGRIARIDELLATDEDPAPAPHPDPDHFPHQPGG